MLYVRLGTCDAAPGPTVSDRATVDSQ